MKHRGLLVACLVTSLSACSVFTPPNQKPVIEDNFRQGPFYSKAEIGIISLSPDRRVVLNHFENKKFCAEPPTEVGLESASVFRAIAEGSLSAEQKAKLATEMAAASKNQVLNRRGQAIQYYAVGSYALCQAYMNNVIRDEKDYMKAYLKLSEDAAKLIAEEVKYLHAVPAPTPVLAPTPAQAAGTGAAPSGMIADLLKMLEEFKRKEEAEAAPAAAPAPKPVSRLDRKAPGAACRACPPLAASREPQARRAAAPGKNHKAAVPTPQPLQHAGPTLAQAERGRL